MAPKNDVCYKNVSSLVSQRICSYFKVRFYGSGYYCSNVVDMNSNHCSLVVDMNSNHCSLVVNMNCNYCYYECFCIVSDLHLAAELGKALLERNRDLESQLFQAQQVAEDQQLEIDVSTGSRQE